MSSNRPTVSGWMGGILLVLAIAFACWAWNQNREARAEAAALAGTLPSLDAAIKGAQTAIERQQRAPAETAAAVARAPAAASQPKAKPDLGAIISAHPALLATYVKAIRALLDQSYGKVFARLNLSPDQIDHLETLVVNDLENQLDLDSTAQAQGLTRDDPAIAKEREQQTADLQAAEQDLLGPQAYDTFHAATRADALRDTVEQLSYMTTFSANPLSGDQSAQLVQVMAQASSDYNSGKDATARTVNWDAVLAQAPAFLTPSQVAVLQGVAQENRFRSLARQFDAERAAAQ